MRREARKTAAGFLASEMLHGGCCTVAKSLSRYIAAQVHRFSLEVNVAERFQELILLHFLDLHS